MVYNKVILVIDDEDEMLSLLDITLRHEGFVVIKSRNAASALHLIRSLTPSLFIVDLMMPGMNGFQLCEEIRSIATTARIPIIILSARADYEAREQALNAGANLYVHKSAFPNGLISEVCKLLNNGNRANYSAD
ncbi:MAG TPA: response regulator [Aggregatilineaceae bacterium]|nr:response regulator [Aggregatilineaceae bacterium]